MGAPEFFQTKDIHTRTNLCKNIFKPETIKNYNGAVEMREEIVRPERNQQLHQF